MIDTLRAAGLLDGLDVAFAAMIRRRSPGVDPRVALGAALASRAPTWGHAAVDLASVAGLLASESADDITGAPGKDEFTGLPEGGDWCAALLAATAVVRRPYEPRVTPLVLDGTRLYLDRLFQQEEAVAADLTRRAEASRPIDERALAETLDALFPNDPANPDDRQRRAAETAARRDLTVVAGGPGTGKTSTVVRILALLAALAARNGERSPRILMVAPTGKAAARLTECVRNEGAKLPRDLRSAVQDATASTIHRALGLRPGGGNDVDPLLADVVVADEASMVALGLMSLLLAAVPATARLVLLGDPDQLASVESGAVLRDVCTASGPVGRAVVRLDRNWRFGEESGIRRLADAINAGDGARALAVLGDAHDVERVEVASPRDLEGVLREMAADAHRRVMAAATPDAALRGLAAFRVLCAHRHGAWGVERIGPAIAGWLAAEGLATPGDAFYPGQPVMVIQNDLATRLYNGDTGVIRDSPAGLRAWFPGVDGAPREIAPSRIPPHETAFATTVHKAQGSEYEHVVVILPDRPSPLITRELLYTAVTRASRRVTMIGSADAVRAGTEARIVRVSGLRDRLG